MSRWPACRAVSSIMWISIHRRLEQQGGGGLCYRRAPWSRGVVSALLLTTALASFHRCLAGIVGLETPYAALA